MPWKWAEDRLKKSHNYWIATTRPDGRPHLMVIWGLWIDGAFYFSTGSQSRKAANLAKNPHCVIGTDRAEEAVVVEGVAELEMSVPMRRKVLDLIERKYAYDMSAFEEPVLSLKEPIFVVRPTVAFGLDEEKSMSALTRWKFQDN